MYHTPIFIQALASMGVVQFWWVVGVVFVVSGIFLLNQKGSSVKSSLSLVWVGLVSLLVCLTTWIKWTDSIIWQVIPFIALSFAGVVVLYAAAFVLRSYMSNWHYCSGMMHKLPPYFRKDEN